jgi:hypothetical protein
MKPQHQLMLRKVGKGKMFPKMKSMTNAKHEISEPKEMKELEKKMEGCGITKIKRKPLKFKL